MPPAVVANWRNSAPQPTSSSAIGVGEHLASTFRDGHLLLNFPTAPKYLVGSSIFEAISLFFVTGLQAQRNLFLRANVLRLLNIDSGNAVDGLQVQYALPRQLLCQKGYESRGATGIQESTRIYRRWGFPTRERRLKAETANGAQLL